MKNSILAAASLAALFAAGALASAADLPGSYAPQAPYQAPGLPPVFTWTGVYVGVNVGGAFGDRTLVTQTTDNGQAAAAILAGGPGGAASDVTNVRKTSAGGVIGGAQLGYNRQIVGTGVVLGIETEFEGSSLHANGSSNTTTTTPAADGAGGVVDAVSAAGSGIAQRLEYSGNVRGRVGYAYDRALVFGTGGFAYGRVVDSAYAFDTAAGTAGAVQTGRTRTGYVVGGGVEYALTNNVTIKGEYLYTDLGRSHAYGTDANGISTISTVNNDFQQVRVGMNYKFGGGTGLLGAIPGVSSLPSFSNLGF